MKFNSLRSRLLLLVALAMAPSMALTVYGGWKESRKAVSTAEENLQRLTTLAAANEAQFIAGARQILMDLSGIPDLLAGPEKCNALLQNMLKKNPDYANFGLIELNGDVSCSAVRSSRHVNLGDRAHFRRAVAERRFIAGNYVFGRVIQKHTINLTYPVIDRNDKVVAVVFAALDLSRLDRFVKDIDLPPGSILITSDAEGGIISRRPDPGKWFGVQVSPQMREAMARKERSPMLLDGLDGVERVHAFARVGTPDISDFVVTIGMPSEQIVAPIRHDQLMVFMALAACTFLALLATWFVGDFMIVRRVRALVGAARKIASGQLDARTGIPYGREEIGYLARAFDDMANALQRKEAEHEQSKEELRAADKRKDEFLAMLAHELRNPLAPISAAAQLLKFVHADEERVRQTSDIIARQVDHMTSLVDDLLDMSRVTRGLVSLDREALDMKRIVSDAVEQAGPLLEKRGHRLSLHLPEAPAAVLGDQKRLIQIVANILNNAAKYTPEGGNISLRLDARGNTVALQVSDDGIGMEPELVSRVFELFAQAERTSDRSQGGLGLGLALVKSLVGLHGGSVDAYSAGPGKGSAFTVRLPRMNGGRADAAREGDPAGPYRPARPLRVMVVDDNADAAHALAMLLKEQGHRVTVDYEAGSALARARTVAPDVCLLDIGLPDIDGNELARRLRSMPETAAAVLIAVTGYGQPQDIRRSMAAGFDHHFVKPVDAAHLASLLAAIGAH